MPRVTKSSDGLRAYLRIRPLTEAELARQSAPTSTIYSVQNSTTLTTRIPPCSVYFRRELNNEETFEFTGIFDEEANQEEVFEKCIKPEIINLFGSTSVLIFAYGITNSGKSYTIRGLNGCLGVIPRFAEALFHILARHRIQYPNEVPITVNHLQHIDYEKLLRSRLSLDGHDGGNDERLHMFLRDPERFSHGLCFEEITGWRKVSRPDEWDSLVLSEQFQACGIWCSYVEIYNNIVFDLLSPRRRAVTIGEDTRGYPFVKYLTRVPVFSANEMLHLFDHGRERLKIAGTKLNRTSSRSHSIFSVSLVAENLDTKTIVIRSMDFCDLAGAERCQKAGGVGTRLVEACKINSSLSALHRCIECLRQRSKEGNQVKPSYRESKLTRLFQPYFEGFGLVRMIANVCLDINSYDETLAVLRFSSLAQQVETSRKDSVHHVRATVGRLQDDRPENANNEDQIGNQAPLDENGTAYFKWPRNQLVQRLLALERENEELANQKDKMLSDWISQLEETQVEHHKEVRAMEVAWQKSLNDRVKEVERECRDLYRQRIESLKDQVKSLKRESEDNCKTGRQPSSTACQDKTNSGGD